MSDAKEIDPDTVSDAVEKFIVAEAEVGPPAAKKSKPQDQTPPSKKAKKLTEDEKAANDLMAKVMRDAKREVDKTLGGAAAANLGQSKSSKPAVSENDADQKAERRSLASWTLW